MEYRKKNITKILGAKLKESIIIKQNHIKKVSAPQATTTNIKKIKFKSRNKLHKTQPTIKKEPTQVAQQSLILPIKKQLNKYCVEKGDNSTMTATFSEKNGSASKESSTIKVIPQSIRLMEKMKKNYVVSLTRCDVKE